MRRMQRRGLLATITVMAASVMIPTPSLAGRVGDPSGFSATPLSATSTITVAKSVTGKLAQSDPSLLGRTDSSMVNVMVKLDYDATASYDGDIQGLAATSPRVTGHDLTGSSSVERAYEAYTGDIDTTFRKDVAKRVPSARLGRSLSLVYGGVAVQVPANQVRSLLSLPNVAAVQVDQLNQPQTDSSTAFIGAPTIWARNGGQALAGQGVIFGDLDTGIWPEHPSFADTGVLSTPPAAPSGVARECSYGDNPLTAEVDVFACNNKVIGGAPFIDTYNAVIGGESYADSARDSDGHGTHTTSTAAGGIVAAAPIFGVDRGPISGVAPGAWVIEYKVCGLSGCFGSDTAAAVEQAILDGVDVINYSISGGSNPFADATELAFLDAYNAGVTVAASAGNSGPAAGSTDHRSPWVVTVAASTQTRAYQSSLTLTSGGDTLALVGASITPGVSTPSPVMMAADPLCSSPLAAGSAAGKIVACQRGAIGRAQKGYNVLQGDAVGMILYNPTLQDTETDNHWLPAVHLADGAEFLAFMAAHPGGVEATFTDGTKGTGQGDVMASFSSRGPGGLFLKPDITAPGVQILAGNTPTPDDVAAGPPGEYFQAIAGTSMSAPHIAGSAILLQSLHPDWSPGAIKSAMMTTATTRVLKEDEITPADPFDFGAGRVDLTKAGAAPVVFEDSASNMAALGNDPLTAMDVNIPSINIPTMPGVVHVRRTATNVTNRNYRYRVSTTSPSGSKIKVVPATGVIRPGQSQTFDIYITSNAPEGQYFGQIRLKARGKPTLHLPVAFSNRQGDVSLAQSCTPVSIEVGQVTTCTVTATNNAFGDASVAVGSSVTSKLKVISASGATIAPDGKSTTAGPVTLAGQSDSIPSIAPGLSPAGYLPLSLFGIAPIAGVGDESISNFNVPAFTLGGTTYTRIGVVSNGYVVLGGGTGGDVDYVPQTLPDPTPPNGVLAPYWTDLNNDAAGAEGIRIGTLSDGVSTWLVVDWSMNLWGTPDIRNMQVWIGVNGVDDVSYTFDPATTLGQDTPAGYGLTVGAENDSGTAGAQIAGPPLEDYVITAAPGAPGESLTYTLDVKGWARGSGYLTSSMTADTVNGVTVVKTKVVVTRR